MPAYCNERYPLAPNEVLNLQVDCTDYLKSGEALTGTPTAVDESGGDLTIDQLAVSTGTLTILGRSVSTGNAITLRVACTAPSTVEAGAKQITLRCGTTSSPAQTKEIRRVIVDVVADE